MSTTRPVSNLEHQQQCEEVPSQRSNIPARMKHGARNPRYQTRRLGIPTSPNGQKLERT